MSRNLNSHKPLLLAFGLASVLVGAFSLALLLNEALRQYTIATIEEIIDEEGEKVKRVKIEKPEPNEEQVREISRNQERKKREELKKKARELRETIYEIEEVVDAQKKIKKDKGSSWDELAEKSQELAEKSQALQGKLADEDSPGVVKPAEEQSGKLTDAAEEYQELVEKLAEQTVTPANAAEAVEEAKELADQASKLEDQLQDALANTTEEEQPEVEAIQKEATELAKLARENYRAVEEFSKSPEAYQPKPSDAKEDMPELADNEVERTSQNEQEDISEPEKMAEVEEDFSKMELDDELGLAMVEPTEDISDDPNLNRELDDGEFSALGNELPSDESLEAMSTAELYEELQQLSNIVDESFAEGQAAELANRKDISLEEAREQVFKPETPKGPDLSNALSQDKPGSREEFKEFNEALEAAVNAAEQMARAANNRKSALMGDTPPNPQAQGNQKQSQAALQAQLQQRNTVQAKMSLLANNQGKQTGNIQDMREVMAESYSISSGGENYREGTPDDVTYKTHLEDSPLPKKARLDSKKTLAQAIPGRRLDINSKRQGWIFLDTWYVIGPWQRPKQKSFEVEFPPETLVDLDATYVGKYSRHRKENMELKWRFVQTENIRINPPDETSDAVYYAYTEVFCEAETEVTVAVASDDMAKLWINDLVVFEDSGLSPWRMDEGFRTILLKPGYNTVLVRVENGPTDCFFSVLLCPTEALRK